MGFPRASSQAIANAVKCQNTLLLNNQVIHLGVTDNGHERRDTKQQSLEFYQNGFEKMSHLVRKKSMARRDLF